MLKICKLLTINTKILKWLSIVGLIVLLDQISKLLAVNNLSPYDFYNLLDLKYCGINFTLTYNLGMAFGWFNYAGNWQNIVFLIIAAIAIISLGYIIITNKNKPNIEVACLNLILSGAIGNAIDRIHYGYVIDFIDAYILINQRTWHWYTFNIADSAICLGVIGFLWYSGKHSR